MNNLLRLICFLRGHRPISVREVGVVARPGGMLPSLDGLMTYEADPDGLHTACQRCHTVFPADFTPVAEPDPFVRGSDGELEPWVTHGRHAPLTPGKWLAPGFCNGCDEERARATVEPTP